MNKEQLEKQIKEEYKRGYIAGLTAYAWWENGVQYVGTCNTTLKKAIEEIVHD